MTMQPIPFSLSNSWSFPLHGVPLRASVPFPRGHVRDPAKELALLDEKGHDVGAQWRTLSTWGDGSARFALMDYAEPHVAPRTTKSLKLSSRAEIKSSASSPARGIQVKDDADEVTIDTGRLRWVVSKKNRAIVQSIRFNNREWLERPWELLVEDVNGQIFRASHRRFDVKLEEPGPHRVIVLIEGDYRNPLGKFMDYKLRLHFSAGGSQVLMCHTIRNRHDGREGRDVRRSALVGSINVSADKSIRRVLDTQHGLNTIQMAMEIPENVDLDTGDYSTIIRNFASLRQDPSNVAGVIKHQKDMSRPGMCAALIDLHEPGVGGMLFKWAMPSPEHEGPMRLASDRNAFEIDFYPAEPKAQFDTKWGPMHLGEGMGKTRDVLFNFHDDSLPMRDLIYESDNLSYPGVVGVPRDAYRAAKVGDVHLTLVPQRNKYPLLETKIDTLLSAQQTYGRQVAGWRDYGDEVGFRGRCPEFGVRQYINNEEDYLHALMLDAWRLGMPYKGRAQARHLMDIDYIDYSADPSRDGADCAHSTNHTDGEAYPSHQWCQGLLFYHLATGDEEALRISKRIGDNLAWWCTGPRSDSLHYSGRESAWPLLSLAALYDITHETKYRDAGMVIIDELLKSEREHGHLAWETPAGSGNYSPYMQLMTFNGIWDMWQATGDETILDLWKRASGPEVERLSNPESWGYLHFRNWGIKWADLTTLARWHALTGDKKYIDRGRNGLRLTLSACPQPLNQTQGFIAMGYRHFIFFLKLADEFGMIDDNTCVVVW
jgi:hypothetical protein